MLQLWQQIIMSLISVAFIIALGWFAGYKKIVDPRHSHSFATYVITFSFPCTLFVLTATTNPSELLNGTFVSGFWLGIMGMFGIGFFTYKFILRRSLRECAQGAFVCSFADMAFMGIPIFTSLLGKHALLSIAIGNICTSLFLIPIVTVFLNTEEKVCIIKRVIDLVTKPLVFAPILGTLYSFAGLPLPPVIQHSLELIGSSTSGVSLFTLGLIMSSFAIRLNKLVGINIILKIILHPLIMIGLAILFGIKGIFAKEAILLCAMPTASMVAMFSLKYSVLVEESTSSTILGTLLSLLTLPVFMLVVEYFFL